MDYANVSLPELQSGVSELIRDVQATFGSLDARQLNWRADASRWSVGQCFDHLVKMNALMLQAAENALDRSKPRSVWQRLPLLPSLFGPVMVRSQAPEAARKYTAPSQGRPSVSDISPDVVRRFVEQQLDFVARLRTADEATAARSVMASPFISVICYTVLDGWRLMFAHGRRHIEQARRVTKAPGFPTRTA